MSNPEYVEAFRSGWRFGFLAGIALWCVAFWIHRLIKTKKL